MDKALVYLKEAQSYINQMTEESFEDMLLFEEGDSQEASNKNSQLNKKANGSILNAITALIESLGNLISTILSKIKTIFVGKDNAAESLKVQYNALVKLIPNETNSYRVEVKNYRKFYADVRKTLNEIEKARKAGNTEQVKTLRGKLDNYFNTEIETQQVPLSQLIEMMESADEISNGEVKRLERLKADLQKTMNNLKADAQANGEDTAELQWECQQASKSVSGWFRGLAENTKSFGRATKDLIGIAKSKGKDVHSIMALCEETSNNPALRSLLSGITGAASKVMDRKADEKDKGFIGSAKRIAQSSKEGKKNVGAAMTLAHNVLKNDDAVDIAGAVGSIGAAIIPPKQKRAKKAATNTMNQLLS